MRHIHDFLETFKETGEYRTPPERLGKKRKNGFWSSFSFSRRALLGSMICGTWHAYRKTFTDYNWQRCGTHLLWEAERMGVEVILEGFSNLKDTGPVVLVSNHMGMFETFAFPPLVLPFTNCAMVLKESLLKIPLLGHTFSTRKCIPVTRKDPRADLKKVLEMGEHFLREENASVLLYPQGTRQPFFDCNKFGTLGIKLAQNSQVPIVPVAIQTSFLGIGKWTKDFGPVNTDIPVRFACGEPMMVTRANAREVQAKCIDFIATKLESWGKVEVRR
jgi:1-acyl-sn-glycerol-3-phosphate acyltransferase